MYTKKLYTNLLCYIILYRHCRNMQHTIYSEVKDLYLLNSPMYVVPMKHFQHFLRDLEANTSESVENISWVIL